MARRNISIDDKIEQQKIVVFQLKDRYDAALAELDRLQQKRNELRNKELLKVIILVQVLKLQKLVYLLFQDYLLQQVLCQVA